jgi:hypothetical protein
VSYLQAKGGAHLSRPQILDQAARKRAIELPYAWKTGSVVRNGGPPGYTDMSNGDVISSGIVRPFENRLNSLPTPPLRTGS